MEYLKLFENHSQYEDFIETEDFVRPNVSHCVAENEVHYNPTIPCVKLDITVGNQDDGKVMWLMWDGSQSLDSDYQNFTISNIASVEIDGVRIDQNDMVTHRDTQSSNILYLGVQMSSGDHVVKYYLVDDTLFNFFLASDVPWYYNDPCFAITHVTNTITLPSTIRTLYGWHSLCPFSRSQIIFDFMKIEHAEGVIFCCEFMNYPQEEQQHLLSVGARYYCK